MALLNGVTLFLMVVLVYVWYFLQKKYNFWTNSGYPYIKPVFPYGSLKGSMEKIHLSHLLQKYYTEMKGKGPFGGLYLAYRPGVLALDLDFVKQILIRDFNSFQERGMYYNEKDDPLSAHLIALDGAHWKPLRTHLTPTFTSGKMRYMFPQIRTVGERLSDCWSSVVADEKDVEIMEYLARYTTDVIGTTAFGIECNSLKDEDADFRVMCRSVFKDPRHSMKVIFLMGAFMETARFLGMKTHKEQVLDFFMGIVKETIEYREKNKVERNDFMDILLKMKNESKDGYTLTFNEIAAQVFVFFAAGFETSAALMSFCLYELALNPEIQNKCRAEIRKAIHNQGGEFNYDAMADMTYMDYVMNGKHRHHLYLIDLLTGNSSLQKRCASIPQSGCSCGEPLATTQSPTLASSSRGTPSSGSPSLPSITIPSTTRTRRSSTRTASRPTRSRSAIRSLSCRSATGRGTASDSSSA